MRHLNAITLNIKYYVHFEKLDMEFAIIVYARPSNKQNLV